MIVLIGTIVPVIMMMFGCITETTSSTPTTVPSGNNSGKNTSLQAVINAASAGAVIDLSSSEYAEITDYKAVINKPLTLQNGSNLKGASLTVSSDGVVLNGINSAGVTTGSSLKIANSSLSSLTIASVSSSGSLSSVEVNGRGDNSGGSTMLTDRTSTGLSGRTSTLLSGRSSAQPPVVEVDNTVVSEDVSVGIANAYLTVEKFTAKKNVSLDAANVQLTINDKATNIAAGHGENRVYRRRAA